jgi:hypothetical protein
MVRMAGHRNRRRRRRRWALAAGLLLGALLVAAHPRARNLVLPGVERHRMADLESGFRRDVERVLAALRRRGFEPRVLVTYRDSRRQDLIHGVSRLAERLGLDPITRVRGGRSCHNRTGSDGEPAALAVDLGSSRSDLTLKQQACFYRALGAAARDRGLVWGGSWRRRNATWRRFGLGWDPGHIQSPRCR